jgi:hypothetical protein
MRILRKWQMIHNVAQPDFEEFVYKQLENDPNVKIRKGVSFVACSQVRTVPTLEDYIYGSH